MDKLCATSEIETVWKAALRSRRTRMQSKPESDAIKRSYVIGTSVVSVL